MLCTNPAKDPQQQAAHIPISLTMQHRIYFIFRHNQYP
jgi:hypothetical protein